VAGVLYDAQFQSDWYKVSTMQGENRRKPPKTRFLTKFTSFGSFCTDTSPGLG